MAHFVVAGTRLDEGFVTRLLPSGTKDSGFSGAGADRRDGDTTAVAVGSTGSIFVAGHDKSGLSGALVVRLQADGFIDTLFGKDGAALVDVASYAIPHPRIRDIQVLRERQDRRRGRHATSKRRSSRDCWELGVVRALPALWRSATVFVTQQDRQAVVNVRRIGGSAGTVQRRLPDRSRGQRARGSKTIRRRRGRLDWGDGDTGDRQITVPLVSDFTEYEPDEYFEVTS